MTNYVLDWDDAFTAGNGPSNLTLGSVDLTFSTSAAVGGGPATQSALVSSAELGDNTEGHLRLEMTATAPGEGFVQTINFDETGFPNEGVRNVAFDLLDVDQNTWQDQVQIIAYDLDGNALPASVITLIPAGAAASASGDIAEGESDALATQDVGNVSVTIDGEISRIDIVYTAGPDVTTGLTSQDIGIGAISFTSDVIYDDSDGADDGMITGTAEDNIIFGGTIADGGLLFTGTGADNDSTFPDDVIQAGGGNDTVFGGAGNDSIVGGEGDDDLRGGDGLNTIEGGAGEDIITGGSSAETISGGADNDIILGGGGTDELNGNGGFDRFLLSANEITGLGSLDGGADNDILEAGFDATNTTADVRSIVYQNIEFLDFSAGENDGTIALLDGQVGDLRGVFFDLRSDSRDNTEIVEITMDSLTTLNLSPIGASNFTSNDFFRVIGENAGESITGTFIQDDIQGNGGEDTLDGASGDDTLSGGAASDTLIGGRGDDSLDGGTGSDSISGEEEDDTIIASFGNDMIDGGDDSDTYDASAFVSVAVAANIDGTASVTKNSGAAVAGTDALSNVETIVAGETSPDTIAYTSNVSLSDVSGLDDNATGIFSPLGGGANLAFGPSEDYQLSDILGGTSPDGSLPAVGPLGDYDITGGDEDGEIAGIAFENFENIAFTIGPDGIVDGLDTGEGMDLGYTDLDGDQITTGADSILGNGGADRFSVSGGADTIRGNDGNDQLTIRATETSELAEFDGGADNDLVSLSVQAPDDFIDLTGIVFTDVEALAFQSNFTGDATVQITAAQANANFSQYSSALHASSGGPTATPFSHSWSFLMGTETTLDLSDDNFSGIINAGDGIVITGDADAEAITGGDLANTIFGNGGNDTIIGGARADDMQGGEGDDMFVYSSRAQAFDDTVSGGVDASPGDDMDVLDLRGLGPFTVTEEADPDDLGATRGTVTFLDGGGGSAGTLSFSGIEEILCFAAHTLITAETGQTRVEDLRIGDLVKTADGRLVPVKWVARQTIVPKFFRERAEMVKIKAGALGHGLPFQDLTVTARHGMVLDDVVIDAALLVNGTSIEWVGLSDLPERFTVYHIETEDHDVILANGAPTETYLDEIARTTFDNYREYLVLYGEQAVMRKNPMPRVSAKRLIPLDVQTRIERASCHINTAERREAHRTG